MSRAEDDRIAEMMAAHHQSLSPPPPQPVAAPAPPRIVATLSPASVARLRASLDAVLPLPIRAIKAARVVHSLDQVRAGTALVARIGRAGALLEAATTPRGASLTAPHLAELRQTFASLDAFLAATLLATKRLSDHWHHAGALRAEMQIAARVLT